MKRISLGRFFLLLFAVYSISRPVHALYQLIDTAKNGSLAYFAIANTLKYSTNPLMEWVSSPYYPSTSTGWVSVSCSDTGSTIMLMDMQNIHVSHNGGVSWSLSLSFNSNGTSSLYGAMVLSKQGVYAYALLPNSDNELLFAKSYDSGHSWTYRFPVTSESSETFSNVTTLATSSSGQYVAFGGLNGNGLYISSDYAESFSTLFGNETVHSVAMSGSGQYMYVSHSGACLLHSHDYGATWSLPVRYYSVACVATRSVSMTTDFTGRFVGLFTDPTSSASPAVYSMDYGSTWLSLSTSSVSFPYSGNVYVAFGHVSLAFWLYDPFNDSLRVDCVLWPAEHFKYARVHTIAAHLAPDHP